MCLRHAARRHEDCRCGRGNKLQCPYCETGQTADRPHSGRPHVTPAQDRYIRSSHLRDRYRMATTTAQVTPGRHNPSISAQTVCNRLREAGLRACRPVVRQVLTRHHRQPMGTNPPSLDQTSKKCSSLTSHGFVSPGVMVRFAYMVEGMSVTPRPVLLSDLEVEGPSWSGAVCHSIIGLSLLSLHSVDIACVTGKTSSFLMWYPSCRLILT
uniref:Transposase Tc1-like domain-containing protein n=1 Tax=Oncorhynchus tshawytscha TaxID=74940 RepID=A0AAZ3RE68_ONCTS